MPATLGHLTVASHLNFQRQQAPSSASVPFKGCENCKEAPLLSRKHFHLSCASASCRDLDEVSSLVTKPSLGCSAAKAGLRTSSGDGSVVVGNLQIRHHKKEVETIKKPHHLLDATIDAIAIVASSSVFDKVDPPATCSSCTSAWSSSSLGSSQSNTCCCVSVQYTDIHYILYIFCVCI
jgi:hypothetical protein